ncbi:hypothetical protein F0L68_18625 [Solihabitans fulvus]|uniref:Uncharacterized protein n=1 Tax=Solihabitans fulvus TaxID=1892852 RepID=A0A5B2XD34_9PSEU|nr:hypothetical protein [Solihabitans fulvus]KAA2261076.1 hypothetical protein F0L68_18625 [Solihabitans fulvus]
MSERDADLLRLIGRRYVIDVLDALDAGPHTQASLRSRLHARRGPLAAALRALAAYGAVQRLDRHGSWDARDTAPVVYRLTPDGSDLVRRLSRLDVWTRFYEHYLHQQP